MFFSVIIPVYNVEPYLAECLDSLTAQDYSNVAFVIVDDGSTDRSGEICETYARKDNRFRVYHIPNGGVSAARNYGLALVPPPTEFVLFIDPDDYLLKTTVFSELSDYLGANSTDLLLFAYRTTVDKTDRLSYSQHPDIPYVLDSQEKIAEYLYPSLIFGHRIGGRSISGSLWRGVFNMEIVRKNQLTFREDIYKAEDWCFYSDYLLHCHRVHLSDNIYYNYRVRSSSAMTSWVMPSLSGVEKSLSILEHIRVNAEKMLCLDQRIVKAYFGIRYVTSAVKYIETLCDRRCPLSFREIHRRAAEILRHPELTENIRKHKTSGRNLKSSVEYMLVRYRLTSCLIAYGRLYSLIRACKSCC